MKETLIIKDLAHLKLLSDPLKLRLLQYFGEQPGTTRKAAEALEEPVTKLYRHVDALVEAELLLVIREQQKRGTVERTFQSAAKRFEVDHKLFQGDDEGLSGSQSIRELLEGGIEEIMAALNTASSQDSLEEDILLTRVRLRGSPEQIQQWREALNDWLENVVREDAGNSEAGDNSETQEIDAGALIAFYPIKDDDASQDSLKNPPGSLEP